MAGSLHMGACPGFCCENPSKSRPTEGRRKTHNLTPKTMSATEILRTQLDALQVEHNSVAAENRKLRKAHSERARVADLEREVTEDQEENVQLSQRVAQLEVALRDVEGANHNYECAKQLEWSVEDLTCEVGMLREQLVRVLGDLEEVQGELEDQRDKAGEMESCLERQL